MTISDFASAVNADHDPEEYAFCASCGGSTERSSIPTGIGVAILYCCDACADEHGPLLMIPHLERFRNAGAPAAIVH